MIYIKQLPNASELIEQYPISCKEIKRREEILQEAYNIITGKSKKKLLIIGPCSADREDAVLDYVVRLSILQEKVSESFLIFPRIYTSKPRTTGMGYKGLLHRPKATCEHDDIISGLIATRKLHQKVILNSGLFPADEMLYPELLSYIADLLGYVAVGARSVENQQHRLTASGLDIPVGMKNPTSGNYDVMLNAVIAAQHPQSLIYNGWEVQTLGNKYSHAILRGYTNFDGKSKPNYYYENIQELYDLYCLTGLAFPAVVIDCSHSNSNKKYDEQQRVAIDVFTSCKMNKSLNKFVKGIMIESYIKDGAQMIGEGIYGKSITDPCLGWEKTEKLVLKLAEML